MESKSSPVWSLADKQAFYAGLDHVLEDSDHEPDTGRLKSARLLTDGRKARSGTAKSTTAGGSLAKSTSETNLSKDPLRSFQQARHDRPKASSHKAPPSLSKSATVDGPAASVMLPRPAPPTSIPTMKRSGKRKRDSTIDLVPEAQQIFKGMHFYFFPNDDKNPVKSLRIMKALEYGATWQKDWNEFVTHAIVDSQFEYNLVLKYLKMEKMPKGVAVVTSNYPLECITFQTIIDWRAERFRVKGYTSPDDLAPPKVAPHSEEQPRSLELKPAGPAVMTRPPRSPKTTDEAASSQFSLAEIQASPTKGAEDDARPDFTNTAVTIASNAEFDAAIKQVRELRHLGLEDDVEWDSRPSTATGPDTDDEASVTAYKNADRKPKNAPGPWQGKFQCMQKHTGEASTNANAATIAILQQMADYYGQMGDEWRIRAYRKAITTLRNHPTKVWTKQQALALPEIGERLAEKIEEITYTNRLRRLDNAKAEPTDQAMQTFMGIYGVGFAKADEWVAAGFRSLDELAEKATLTENQRIGLEHYEDFNSRIPRAEVEQHGNVVRKALQKIDPALEVVVGGSYRRGSPTSGDIDCLITRPGSSSEQLRTVVLDKLVPALIRSGFLVASLASTSKDDGSRWLGASCLPGSKTWRRLDLLLVPEDELGAALIYWTGNDIFNRSLRLLASKMGMRLNQKGLYNKVMRRRGREQISEGTLVEGRSEKRIFEILGVPWRPPEHRIC